MDIATLAVVLHDTNKSYKLFDTNCYWLSSMVLNIIRLYTKRNICLDGLTINWDEDLGDTKGLPTLSRASTFRRLGGKTLGSFSKLGIVLNVTPKPKLYDVIVSWRERVKELRTDIQKLRLEAFRNPTLDGIGGRVGQELD